MSELPEGWIACALNSICNFIGGSQPSKDHFIYEPKDGYIRLIQIRDYKSDKNITFIPRELARRFCTKTDVMIGRYGPPLFQILRGIEGAYNVALIKAVPKSEQVLLNDFLYYLLLNPPLRNYIIQSSERTVGQDGVRKDLLEAYEIGLPPLAEQRRIVAKLETLLGKVEACQQRLAKIPVILKRFRQAVLAAACSGELTIDWRNENPVKPLTNSGVTSSQSIPENEILFDAPLNWQWRYLGSMASFINGDRGKNYPNRNEYVPTGIPFINTGHIQPNGSLNLETMHYLTREKFDSLRSGKIQKGDLVYCLRGATLGKTAIIDFTEGAIASSLVIIRLTKVAIPKYAYYFLVSQYGREFIKQFDNGSAQPNLAADSVKRYIFPLPPLTEQQEIVRRVEALFQLADQLEARYKQAQAQVDKLQQAILAKAFRGELVPTEAELARQEGRTYESAAVLLERINAARANTENKPKKRQAKKAEAR